MPSVGSGEVSGTPALAGPARWDGLSQGSAWSAYTMAALGSVGQPLVQAVPGDIATYCPNYGAETPTDRARFWTGLISALVGPESSYNPAVTYTEPGIVDAAGNNVVSRGLLQISQESANLYGCQIGDAEMLHDPQTNLTCGVRILSRLVPQHGTIASTSSPWRGAAAYWSPFRRTNDKAAFAAFTSAQAYCQP